MHTAPKILAAFQNYSLAARHARSYKVIEERVSPDVFPADNRPDVTCQGGVPQPATPFQSCRSCCASSISAYKVVSSDYPTQVSVLPEQLEIPCRKVLLLWHQHGRRVAHAAPQSIIGEHGVSYLGTGDPRTLHSVPKVSFQKLFHKPFC